MFYEHVSRQSTVDTSKHRRGRDLLLQQISFSFHHMSSPVVDFGHTVVPPSLLSCVSFSSLLSLPPWTCTPQCRHLWALQSKPSTTGKSQSILSSSGPWKPRNTPRWSCRHADFSVMHRKQNSCFPEGNVITNINILILKALPHLPVSFWCSFCWSVGWVIVLIRLPGKQVSNFPQTNT